MFSGYSCDIDYSFAVKLEVFCDQLAILILNDVCKLCRRLVDTCQMARGDVVIEEGVV